MAHRGRPWRDYKPPPSGPGVGRDPGRRLVLDARGRDRARRLRRDRTPRPVAGRPARRRPVRLVGASATSAATRWCRSASSTRSTRSTSSPRPPSATCARTVPASMAALVRVAPGPLANWEHLADTIRTGVVDPADRRHPRGVLRAARAGDVPHPAARRHPSRVAPRVGPPPRPARARPRRRSRAVGDRDPRAVARQHRRRERPAGRDRPRRAHGRRTRPRRAGAVPRGRLPRHRASRPARTTSWCSATCAAPRATNGRARCSRRAFAALRTRRHGAHRRLLRRQRPQVQPVRRADGPHHARQHRTGRDAHQRPGDGLAARHRFRRHPPDRADRLQLRLRGRPAAHPHRPTATSGGVTA